MACKPRCPDTPKGTKQPGDCGGSNHQDKQIGFFKEEVMQLYINEIHRVEEAARLLNKKPEKLRNQIPEEYGLSPSTVSKRMTGKVLSVGPALGGA